MLAKELVKVKDQGPNNKQGWTKMNTKGKVGSSNTSPNNNPGGIIGQAGVTILKKTRGCL